MTDPEQFDEPWQAQLFALTVAMSEAGHFTWVQWADAFGATLKAHGAARPLDGSGDYYAAWLETLERLLDRSGLALRTDAEATRAAWEKAYLTTPHGEPVQLPG